MDKKSNPCFLAYIVFLCGCFVYQLLCKAFPDCSFEHWDKLVIAVTMSSCLFSIADIVKTVHDTAADIVSKMNDTSQQENASLRREKAMFKKLVSAAEATEDKLPADSIAIIHDLIQKYEELESDASETEEIEIKQIEEFLRKKAFKLNFSGFLVLLIILVSDFAYFLCLGIQDILTFAVFILILGASYAKEVVNEWMNKESAALNARLAQTDKMLKDAEGIYNTLISISTSSQSA